MKRRKTFKLLAFSLVVVMLFTGCSMTSEERAQQREELSRVEEIAKEYLKEKYSRLFNVKKSQQASGEGHEDNIFITFTDGTHVYYDSEAEKCYDDKQTAEITDDIYHKIWQPMMNHLGGCDDMGQDTQTFGLTYESRGNSNNTVYSLFHNYYDENMTVFAEREGLSVSSKSLYIVAEDTRKADSSFNYVNRYMSDYFKNQKSGDLSIFIVTPDYKSSEGFDHKSLDITNEGCLAELRFGAKKGITYHHVTEIEEDLSVIYCGYDSHLMEKGEIELVEVSDSDLTEKKIRDNIDANTKNMEAVFKKTRVFSRKSPIYTVECLSDEVKLAFSDGGFDLAFMPNKGGDITKLVAYDVKNSTVSTQEICKNGGVGKVKITEDNEWYFWFE